MGLVRRAVPEDAGEVLRLRQVLIDSARPDGSCTQWQKESLPTLSARLGDPEGDFAAFVVDHPNRPGALAAVAVGTVEYRIGFPGSLHGRVGYVFSVATDPDARRRGYARACMEELLDWFGEEDVWQVQLNASAQAESLYASLGFVRRPDSSMQLRR